MLRKSVTLLSEDGVTVKVDALIDPSAAFGLFPSSLLERLGARPFERRMGRQVGQVKATLGDHVGHIISGFGEEDCEPRLGFHNLASLFVQVNEKGGDLEPLVVQYHEHPKLEIDV